ncbi:MAG: hypothetical protein GWN18_16750, partial [Thermoplasmata archaeon]|nr:hypothetical protein [Thermoplasmata archaeon]NIS21600.1 hypothetical protein [Thermoplasmata archaeon]NIT79185.1 hypothetical protein [Thermoplasmata archaeon]NIU50639.1 hypothetical protein [Thermoplasmata archaeon]NIV80362.1 hypothetical protein [Thermoplasmata archaeon]
SLSAGYFARGAVVEAAPVRWTSLNPDRVTVDEGGGVRAMRWGRAAIVATSDDGSADTVSVGVRPHGTWG